MTASQRTNVERTVRFPPGAQAGFVRVFAHPRCHTTVVMAIGAYVALSYYNPMAALARLPSVSGKLRRAGHQDHHGSPKIAGIGRNQRAYQVIAETAVQDITKPDQLELKNLRAESRWRTRHPGGDGENRLPTHQVGQGHAARARRVHHRAGLNAKMREAVVDMKKGTLPIRPVRRFQAGERTGPGERGRDRGLRRGGAFHARRHIRPRCRMNRRRRSDGGRAASWLRWASGSRSPACPARLRSRRVRRSSRPPRRKAVDG